MDSRGVSALLLALMVVLVTASSMPSAMAYSGNATYIDYKPERANWEKASVNCPDLTDENFPLAYRQRYRWTEFSGDCGPYTGACGCHKCLQVTNAATSDDASVTVRIIEVSSVLDGDPVIWMDKPAFDQIDTDGQGAALGGAGIAQLMVNYEGMDCEDPE